MASTQQFLRAPPGHFGHVRRQHRVSSEDWGVRRRAPSVFGPAPSGWGLFAPFLSAGRTDGLWLIVNHRNGSSGCGTRDDDSGYDGFGR